MRGELGERGEQGERVCVCVLVRSWMFFCTTQLVRH